MIRVGTSSRLHFGLLGLPGHELPGERRFGGVGLMIERPGLQLTAVPAPHWSAAGPLAERIITFAGRFTRTMPPAVVQPQRFHLEQAAPEHAGLGTGTQLGLAVARALAAAWNQDNLSAAELARRVGRGARSALGVHGFQHGGLLVEGGKHESEPLSPLLAHYDFPDPWRILLAMPPGPAGLHGGREVDAFAQLTDAPAARMRTETLCRLVLLALLPALVARDLEEFGEALYEYNRRVGEAFAPVQGGPYAGAATVAIVAFLRDQGVRGVGQSSWGPTVFGVVEDEEQGQELTERLRRTFGLSAADAFVARAANHGACVVAE